MPANFKTWLRSQIRWLQAHEPYADDLQLHYDAAGIIREARRRAVAAGLPDAGRLCRTGEALELTKAQEILAACLAALPKRKQPKDGPLTIKQAAKRFNIARRTLYRLCQDGEVKCSRLGAGRGTIRINPPDLERYLAKAAQPAVSGSLYD
jgi:excisionase family DNA binding protein